MHSAQLLDICILSLTGYSNLNKSGFQTTKIELFNLTVDLVSYAHRSCGFGIVLLKSTNVVLIYNAAKNRADFALLDCCLFILDKFRSEQFALIVQRNY